MITKKHYIAGSGEYGCLYDNCQSFDRLSDAIDYLAQLFYDTRGVKTNLRKYRYCDLSQGADYCEIVECACNDSTIHNDN